MTRRQQRRRQGLSLLEVLVALAIFMLSLVVISQMVDSGAQRGLRSQKMTQAAILAEAKMEEIVAGASPYQTSGSAPLDGTPGWSFAVNVEPESWSSADAGGQSVNGLSTVHVTVSWSGTAAGEPVEYTLSRVVLNPQLRIPQPEQSSTSSTSQSPSGSSGGSSR